MNKVIHKADTRGHANFGWLNSRHTFSFGQYFDPERVQFGMLRVLNDDIVEGGAGFPTHPHNNMEIISIPLSGSLAHRDSTGTEKAIHTGEVQIMSAGAGLTHSEYNFSESEIVNFLQIWVLPKEKNIEPRYDQRNFDEAERKNKFQTVVAPNHNGALWINQDAWFSLVDLEAGNSITYELNKDGNGVYAFVIDGDVTIENEHLGKRDALGISNSNSIEITSNSNAKLLTIEVPMN
jgi:redox-sensitive bicupin YhaK (pirin superfamily)